jgi:hypothetical protein
MTVRVERPTFYEQQILGAADLEAQVVYARGALARHERCQHSWGVVHGLELTKTAEGFSVSPGLMVDGTGRQIVVSEAYTYRNQDFVDDGVLVQGDPEGQWYPVFVDGVDELERPSPFRSEQCAAQATNRVAENFIVSVGRPGSELSEPSAPEVGDGPGGADGSPSWPVLVGYVQWNGTANAIKAASAQPEEGKSARYAGVYADTVAARGGSLTLRTRETVQAGKPALNVREKDDSLLQVGKLLPNGSIDPLLTLNASGDLTVTGKIKGMLAPGAIVSESGLVSDGITIALPSGVTQKMVDDGKAEVKVILSPRVDPRDAPTLPGFWYPNVRECWVDPERMAHCRVLWVQLPPLVDPATAVETAATFSYLIVASVRQD